MGRQLIYGVNIVKKSDGKKTWYVQPDEGAWVNGVFEKQNGTVLMTDDEAKYLVMANVLGDKPVVKEAPTPPATPAEAATPAEKPAKKGSAK